MLSKDRIGLLILIASIVSPLAGCGQQEETARVVQEANRESARADQEQQARKAAEKQRQEAESQRAAAEKARQDAEQSKSYWQNMVWVVAIAAIVLLIFGAGLGSSARKDAKARKSPDE
jgi:hypothetical protein